MEIDLLSVVISGLLTLLFAAIGSFFMWKLIGPRVVTNAIRSHLGPVLLEWFFNPSIKTGQRIKLTSDNGDVKEVDEVLAPIEYIMKQSGEIVFAKLMGKMGGDVRKKQAVQGDIVAGLTNPASPLYGFLGSVNPALLNRALKDGDYIPIIMEQLGPAFVKFIEAKLNKAPGVVGNAGNGGL